MGAAAEMPRSPVLMPNPEGLITMMGMPRPRVPTPVAARVCFQYEGQSGVRDTHP